FVARLAVSLPAPPHPPRLTRRAALEDRRSLPSAVPRLLRPLYQQGVDVLAERGGSWQPADLPHLATALYLLIFGYFASAALFEAVTQQDPCGPAALQRQRQFLKAALAKLFTTDDPRGASR